MPFEPVIDGDILPARPIDSIVGGAGAGVDILIGTNSEEQRLMIVPNGVINYINEDILAGTIAAYGLPVSETIATYRSIRSDDSAGELFAAIVTDWFYRIPAIRMAEAHAILMRYKPYRDQAVICNGYFFRRLGTDGPSVLDLLCS